MSIGTRIVALASPRIATSLDDGLERVQRSMSEAAAQGADIVCFPEAYLPGLRGQDFEVAPFTTAQQERALQAVTQWARTHSIATILGMERLTDAGRQIAAYVIDANGRIQGYQTKNQLDPTEDAHYVPGDARRLFTINGLAFGVAICHEGWRYPETVRWAAMRGAQIVFHPQLTGSDRTGVRLTQWGAIDAPYYEKAMRMRSIENTIYFASVNYAMRYQESATSLIAPSGECQAYLPYGEEGVLVQEIDADRATGLLAKRYAPQRYRGECMTLDEFFRIAEKDESRAIESLRMHPALVVTSDVAGDYQEGQRAPAIVHAAHRGLSRVVEALLDAGADIESTGLGGGTSLHVAAWSGHRDTVRILVDHDAPLDRRCAAFGATPLGWAAHGFGPDGCFPKRDHAGVVEILLRAGANPELANRSGNRPVDLVQEPAGNPLQVLLEGHRQRGA